MKNVWQRKLFFSFFRTVEKKKKKKLVMLSSATVKFLKFCWWYLRSFPDIWTEVLLLLLLNWQCPRIPPSKQNNVRIRKTIYNSRYVDMRIQFFLLNYFKMNRDFKLYKYIYISSKFLELVIWTMFVLINIKLYLNKSKIIITYTLK